MSMADLRYVRSIVTSLTSRADWSSVARASPRLGLNRGSVGSIAASRREGRDDQDDRVRRPDRVPDPVPRCPLRARIGRGGRAPLGSALRRCARARPPGGQIRPMSRRRSPVIPMSVRPAATADIRTRGRMVRLAPPVRPLRLRRPSRGRDAKLGAEVGSRGRRMRRAAGRPCRPWRSRIEPGVRPAALQELGVPSLGGSRTLGEESPGVGRDGRANRPSPKVRTDAKPLARLPATKSIGGRGA